MAGRMRGVDLVVDAPSPRGDGIPKSSQDGRPSAGPACDAQSVAGQDPYEFAYLDLRSCLERIRQDILKTGTFDIKSIFDRIAVIGGNPQALFGLYRHTSLHGSEPDYILTHLINVMIYSMRIARKMKYSTEGLIDIGLAAVLHDAGMFQVAPEILSKPDKLTPEEAAEVKKHTCSGGHILERFREQFPLLVCVAEQHHEREDGSGYPAGLSGSEVHECAKIVALADTYEAMTHDRPHRKAVSVRTLLDSKDRRMFSRDVLKAFLDAMQVYPIGSLVELNARCVCKVIDTNIDNPLKPVVREMIDARGDRVKNGRVINLREQGNLLWVTKAIDETDAGPLRGSG
jgi:HD-GYP domain-containing protein (c-di-GMP phosphodiesterase class II)